MLSEAQEIEKTKKIKLVVDEYLKYDNITIEELSKIVKIPSSSIQRYLNDIHYIISIYGENSKEILKQIKEKLSKSKEFGKSKGGTISTINNVPIRDNNGKFRGNKKR